MKLKVWLSSATALLAAASVLAQNSNTLPPVIVPPGPAPSAAPAPQAEAASAPEAAPARPKHVKHKARPKPKKEEPGATNSVTILDPPVTAEVKCNVLDVRGQGSFTGEIITYLKKGEAVTVLEEITLGHIRPGEPKQWSKIVMPANTAVWVNADYINGEDMTVKSKKLNVRGGPGENYSVVARLDKGAVVKEIGRKEGWIEIAAPTNAYAFVASEFLEPLASPVASAAPAAEQTAAAPAPAPTVVVVPPNAPPPAESPTAPAPSATAASEEATQRAPQPVASAPSAEAPASTPGQPPTEEGPRVVTREGYVHHARNIEAPTSFELHDIRTGVLTEYLQPAPGQKSFKTFLGTRVRLTGTEYLDPDWPLTPVLHVETVDLMP